MDAHLVEHPTPAAPRADAGASAGAAPSAAGAAAVGFASRLRPRGDGGLVSAALAALMVVAVSLTSISWWSAQAQRDVASAMREQQVTSLGPLLSRTAEQMISSGELSALRRTLVDAGREWGLGTCRILVADDQVLADADPKRINTVMPPAHWGNAAESAAGHPMVSSGGIPIHVYPLVVPGHGIARLELAAAPANEPFIDMWRGQSGVGMIGAITVAMLALLYRRTRLRFRSMLAVRDAVLAAGGGDRRTERLEVDPNLGPEARAWNRVLVDVLPSCAAASAGGHGSSAAAVAGTAEAAATCSTSSSMPRRAAQNDLDAACDVMSNGLLVVDARLRVKFANGAAAVYLRCRREQAAGGDLASLIDDRRVLDAVGSVAAGSAQGPVVVEVERAGDAGTGVLRFSIRPVRKGDAAAAMVVIEDVTQQRVAEAARNNFVAQVAHELRAPLTNIRLYVESAIDDNGRDPALRANCLNVINQESRRLERIVGEMLSISEIEAGGLRVRKDDVHLDVLLDETRVDYAPQAAEKRITLEFRMPPKLPVIQGDRDKIAMAVHNLVGNAIKYTPDGGRVTVTPEVERGQVAIEVADTGIGIGPAELELVFERFYRAKDARVAKVTGTGLGLTLAREVARLHGGDVVVQSQVDKGSTFTLTLPVGSASAAAAGVGGNEG